MITPRIVPPLDPDFRPVVLANHTFLDTVRSSGDGVPLMIALERESGAVTRFETEVFSDGAKGSPANFFYVERLVKTLLWQRGGWKITIKGPKSVGECIKEAYAPGGDREFDADFMGSVYGRPFTVEVAEAGEIPTIREKVSQLGGGLTGCRIGFDLGASDLKVAAVIDGETAFAEEIAWNPGKQRDPAYHYDIIMDSLKRAAVHMPRVDCIGGSAAGIYIANRVRVASLFRGVPMDLFRERVEEMFLRIKDEWAVPFVLVNDGEVAALAGAMWLGDSSVLGIALGSSEAGGYVNREGKITGWLDELAFVPLDLNPDAPVDEWSGDRGCGAQYLSQQAVIRLAPRARIGLDENRTPAENLRFIQDLLNEGDERAKLIFETIGCYVGYAIASYADLYDIRHVLLLGRVTSGKGGDIILEHAEKVLRSFPKLVNHIESHMPGEAERRVGQAVAAASLAILEK